MALHALGTAGRPEEALAMLEEVLAKKVQRALERHARAALGRVRGRVVARRQASTPPRSRCRLGV